MSNIAYKNYWKRKKLLSEKSPRFPLLKYWDKETLSPAEEEIYSTIQSKEKILDFGAGDLRVKKKLVQRGYSGVYETLDIGDEYEYDHQNLNTCSEDYGAILLLDVIEHLRLEDGLKLILELCQRLKSGGALVIQTPNAKCIRSPLSTDMTHLQTYSIQDLWAYLEAEGLDCRGFRVVFSSEKTSFIDWPSQRLISRMTGCDYADNILLVAEKK